MLWQNISWMANVWVSTEDVLRKACLCALSIIRGGVHVHSTVCVWIRRVGLELRTKSGMFVLKPCFFFCLPPHALFIYLISLSVSCLLPYPLFCISIFSQLSTITFSPCPCCFFSVFYPHLCFSLQSASPIATHIFIFFSFVSIFLFAIRKHMCVICSIYECVFV